MTLAYGETAARELSKCIHAPVADETALGALPSTQFTHLETIRVGAALWYYDSASSASGSSGSVVVPADSPSTGRFLIDDPLGDVPATRTLTAGAGLTGGGPLAADRSFAVGAGSGITVNADDVAVTFGAVGEMAAAANANAAGSTAKSARIDHTHALPFQGGTSTLSSGTVTISGVTLTASSRILVTMKDPGAGAITGMAGFDVPVASRDTGAGSFVVNAIDDAKAVINTAVCTFDYLIYG